MTTIVGPQIIPTDHHPVGKNYLPMGKKGHCPRLYIKAWIFSSQDYVCKKTVILLGINPKLRSEKEDSVICLKK